MQIQRRGFTHALPIEIHDEPITALPVVAYLDGLFPKIDRAFIKDMPENTDDVAIARTIVAMAKSLGLTTVAEGVETVEQLELLKTMGCDQIQGYFFSRPLPADDFMAFYSARL